MADSTLKPAERLNFMRITVLGMSGCGKTSLITAFSCSTVPIRHVSTNSAVIYYKKMEVKDEGEFDTISRPILVEIEDTPGSEKGPDGAGTGPEDDDEEDDGKEPEIKKGSRVELKDAKKRNEVLASFQQCKLEYKKMMDGMLGKEYTVKVMARDGTVGLPSPDGSEGGVWNFPKDCVKLKITPDLPLDQYLNMLRAEVKLDRDPQKRREQQEAFKKPMLAYTRPVGPRSVDKAVTQGRMGFLICFDLSDQEHESLKEAMHIYTTLQKDLKNKARFHVKKPVIMFVGTKADKTSNWEAVEANHDSATMFCEKNDIQCVKTSALRNENIDEAFNNMIDQISQNGGLWAIEGVTDGAGEGEDDGGSYCVVA